MIGGVVAGVAATAMTSERRSASAPTSTPVADPLPDVEVKKPVLVMNDDGTATLSARLVNHTKTAFEINSATAGQPEDSDAPVFLLYGQRQHVPVEPAVPIDIGGVGDGYRLRASDRVQIGSTLPVTLKFSRHKGYANDAPLATFVAPVVARTAAHPGVANNGPNDAIAVREAKIVVVPGQEKAYIGGWMESSIADSTEIQPATSRSARPSRSRSGSHLATSSRSSRSSRAKPTGRSNPQVSSRAPDASSGPR